MPKICFDFDGVLVRSQKQNKELLWSTHLEADLGIDLTQKAKLFSKPHWHEVVIGKVNFRDRLQTTFSELKINCDIDLFINYWLEKDLNWYEEVVSLADELCLRKQELFVTTNQDKLRSARIRALPQIQKIFCRVITSSDLGVAKPNPEFFLQAAKILCPAKEEKIILIDDDSNNVMSAVEAGWVGIHFNPDLDSTARPKDLRQRLLREVEGCE